MYFYSEGLETPKSGYVLRGAQCEIECTPHINALSHTSFFYNSLMVTLQERILERLPHANNIVGYLPSHLDKLECTPADEKYSSGYNSIIV